MCVRCAAKPSISATWRRSSITHNRSTSRSNRTHRASLSRNACRAFCWDAGIRLPVRAGTVESALPPLGVCAPRESSRPIGVHALPRATHRGASNPRRATRIFPVRQVFYSSRPWSQNSEKRPFVWTYSTKQRVTMDCSDLAFGLDRRRLKGSGQGTTPPTTAK